jgi:hypothetical protein
MIAWLTSKRRHLFLQACLPEGFSTLEMRANCELLLDWIIIYIDICVTIGEVIYNTSQYVPRPLRAAENQKHEEVQSRNESKAKTKNTNG